jgi:aldose 1-epimerase
LTEQAIEIVSPGGNRARVLRYGARLQSLDTPDRDGRRASIVLGFPDADAYRRDTAFIGAVIGRYANRIAGGRFTLGQRIVTLPLNDGPNHLHGGPGGFYARDWTVTGRDARSVTLALTSEDGDQGYPGRLQVTARYAFAADEALLIELGATSDAATILNLTHHAYFDLAAMPRDGGIGDHLLTIAARHFTPIDASASPDGVIAGVAGTPFDFRAPRRIADGWDADDAQIALAGGYDHNFAIDGAAGALRPMATVVHPGSGRVLHLSSTAPGLQFYSGNAFGSIDPGWYGRCYGRRDGFCLEPQHYPDSPNQPGFPSAVIGPGVIYRHVIRLGFDIAPR